MFGLRTNVSHLLKFKHRLRASAATGRAAMAAIKNMSSWIPGQVSSCATEFVVIRHGETTWNAKRMLQGQMESELSSLGKLQATAVAERLAKGEIPFTAIYSSDLQRAYDTALEISKLTGFQIYKDKGLRERHLGLLQGFTREESKVQQPKAHQAFTSRNRDTRIPGGGESKDELHQRVKKALEDIAEKHPGERVVVVSHGGVINCFHEEAIGCPPPSRVINASIHIVQIANGKQWTICSWGDVSHLEGVGFRADAFGGGPDSA